MRLAILLHRYLGIAIGFVIAIWCLSGFVMMYVPYPEFTDAERVAGLEPLAATPCCDASITAALDDALRDEDIVSLRIEGVAGRPLMRLRSFFGERAIDLGSSAAFTAPSTADIAEISSSFARSIGFDATATDLGTVDVDQWTVSGEFDAYRPLQRFSANDSAGSQWYVSTVTGEVVQFTTFRERFWSWLGAVPHWIYFTTLRQHPELWAKIIIWLTIASVFLTSLGIYIGINRLAPRRKGRVSPYRGAALWHHYTGLVFGVLVLSWLTSGLFSMNPWGILEGRSFAAEYENLNGGLLAPSIPLRAVEHLRRGAFPPDAVRIDSKLFLGEPALVAWRRDGARMLLDVDTAAALPARRLPFEAAAGAMRPNVALAEQGWLDSEDAYYYSHHERTELPVYRVVYADGERIYLDGTTGELIYAVDSGRRWYRWLFAALHRGDFAAAIRSRPVWDILMISLLVGVSLIALTGTWLGAKRLLR
jgi:hypothetical protein